MFCGVADSAYGFIAVVRKFGAKGGILPNYPLGIVFLNGQIIEGVLGYPIVGA